MTTPDDFRGQLLRLWDSGAMLSARLRNEALFPYRIPLRGPTSRALSEEFDAVRAWIHAWESDASYRLEWSEINHRTLGRNRIPAAVSVASEADALRIIDKVEDAARFADIVVQVSERMPRLLEWLERKPLAALACADDWPRLLDALLWFEAHPRCRLYLRQIDISGVDTKFIEERKPLLTELLDAALAPEYIDACAPGWRNFERRYGLRSKPNLIRFRVLDRQLAIHGLMDLSVPAAEFAALNLTPERVFITENEINGLAFPDIAQSVVIFGLGYALDRLAGIEWLQDRAMHYWGDIDTHGFAMLDRVRAIFPAAQSLLMDRDTFFAHERYWVRESTPYHGELTRLNVAEQSLYDDLRYGRLGERVRLEQERVSYSLLQKELEKLTPCS